MKYRNSGCFWLQQFTLHLDDFVSTICKAVKITGTGFSRHLWESEAETSGNLMRWLNSWVFRGICVITGLPALGFLLQPEIRGWLVESLGKNFCFPEISSTGSTGDFSCWIFWGFYFLVKFIFLLKCFCLTWHNFEYKPHFQA